LKPNSSLEKRFLEFQDSVKKDISDLVSIVNMQAQQIQGLLAYMQPPQSIDDHYDDDDK
jgi:hypothetical protein